MFTKLEVFLAKKSYCLTCYTFLANVSFTYFDVLETSQFE